MLLVILGIFLAIVIVTSIISNKTGKSNVECTCGVIGIISIICCIALIIACCCLTVDVKTESVLDKKIAMYQEENAKIEAQISEIVQHYMAYEGQVFKDSRSSENAMTLAALFPELKSDTLVQKQIEVYAANNARIKKLKEDKVSLGTEKWILYFGS
jgi:hypothetical protein